MTVKELIIALQEMPNPDAPVTIAMLSVDKDGRFTQETDDYEVNSYLDGTEVRIEEKQ